ncbi:hypothetical protein D3C72_1523310 [compost metagenome]
MGPEPALVDLPLQARVVCDDVFKLRQDLFVKAAQVRHRIGGRAKLDGQRAKRPGDAPQAGVGDACGQAMLLGCGARRKVTTQAPAAEHDAFRIDDVELQREVDHRRDDGFPIGAQIQALLNQHLALPRSIENQAMVATARCRHGGREIKIRDGAVVPIREDDKRPGGVLLPGRGNQVGRHGSAFERNPHRQDRHV